MGICGDCYNFKTLDEGSVDGICLLNGKNKRNEDHACTLLGSTIGKCAYCGRIIIFFPEITKDFAHECKSCKTSVRRGDVITLEQEEYKELWDAQKNNGSSTLIIFSR
jgi:hypothetical protein